MEDIINRIHETIIGPESYNDNIKRSMYFFTKDEQARKIGLKNSVDKFFNAYLY